MNTHFISGLPRSGSTLLAGLLRQNCRFHAAMSSPISVLMQTVLEQMGASGEFYTFFDNHKRREICQAIYWAYYQDKQEKEVIFDTSRVWTARLHQLVELFDDFKVICCVRNPAWIMDSFERIYRKNPFDYSKMFSPQSRQTVYSRCEALATISGPLGSSWTALKEAYYGDFSNKLLLVDYDILTQHPGKSLKLLYQFIDEPWFEHNFDNVEYVEDEFDLGLGVKGLHAVKGKVRFSPRRTILPPELFVKYEGMAFWKDTKGTEASIIASASKTL